MGFNYNNGNITKSNFNGTSLSKILFNGTSIWAEDKSSLVITISTYVSANYSSVNNGTVVILSGGMFSYNGKNGYIYVDIVNPKNKKLYIKPTIWYTVNGSCKVFVSKENSGFYGSISSILDAPSGTGAQVSGYGTVTWGIQLSFDNVSWKNIIYGEASGFNEDITKSVTIETY